MWPFGKKATQAPQFGGPDYKSPERFILSFATDYKAWNDFCFRSSESATGHGRDDRYSTLYAQFLAPFLAAGGTLQLISYGSDSTFDPALITFSDTVSVSGGIEIAFSVANPQINQSHDYVALVWLGNNVPMQLAQVYYIDPYAEPGEERLAAL